MLVVKNYLDQKERKTMWESNKPSVKWFRLFRKRHPEIVFRKPQLLGKQRALITRKDILDWFDGFTSKIKLIDPTIFLEPERIYNCDESGFSLNALSGRILTYMSNNFVYQVGSEAKTLITALVCCSATGHYTWPMLIYPGTQFRGFRPWEVFENSFIGRSESGWINQDLFYEWVKQVFVPQTAHVKKPLLLLLDGHVSHQSVKTSALCDENGIQLHCLPPHSFHILQPLGVGVFKTMKCEWKKAVKRQNETEIVTNRTFAITFKDAYETTIARPLAEKAFRACGLYF
ncbi:tigger transposable element-derived protein 6-like protein [Plakobranchus ocellatus]|uniref:Tigger transposable element-derived protein 6-like protein n=1 Tax=Plakobranchus ocellatus TaxID=259542 RepID=A0AAV4CJM1_9GAST|nr:tigger transposable element-derived protein 6-like protein [Plakobranchus ocellatus]